MIGATLGRYRIVAKLGEGGMGTVWRAEDPALGRTVALKLLSPALLGSEQTRQRFQREARAASQLRHPNISTVHDVGNSEDGAWIAYEFIDGETVAARCQRGPLPIAEAVTLGGEMAAALAHAHSRGVLHRDVTAGNVMVTREGHAVLVDFGLARPENASQLTTTGMMMGTAGYVAPEVLRGQPGDERSDLYGLGAVVYKMITGRLPFEGGPPESLLYRVLNEPVSPPSELRPETPPALERAVTKLLARDPADRFETANEVLEALAGVSPSQLPTPAEVRRRSISRWLRGLTSTVKRVGRVRVGAVALASIVVLLSALWLAWQRGWLPWTEKGPQVLAVLPFENVSPDAEDAAYVGEGLGEEMAAKLGEGASYRVLPWATSRQFVAGHQSLTDIARKLHASVLLVGSFRADENRIRVTASLIDGRSGLQKWSRAFDEAQSDLMTLQVNIALGVSERIQGALGPEQHDALSEHPASNPEAYAYYLHGATYFQSPDTTNRMMAELYFAKAIEMDPHLAEAYVGRGAAYVDGYFRGQPGGRDRLRLARADFEQALQIRPGMPRAQRGLISVAYETGQVEDMYRIAVEAAKRGPNDIEGLLTRGWVMVLGGLPADALPVLDRVLALDGENREAAWFAVVASAWSGRFDDGYERGRRFTQQFGEDPEVYTWMACCADRLGRLDDATLLIERSLALFGDEQSNLYVLSVAASFYQKAHNEQRLQALYDHWLPILEARREASPDNIRVLDTDGVLQAKAGKRMVATRIWVAIDSLAARNRGQVGGPIMGALDIACELGRPPSMAGAIKTVRGEDLAAIQYFADGPMAENDCLTRPPGRTPEVEALVADVRIRVAQLRERYGRQIGLAAEASPPQNEKNR